MGRSWFGELISQMEAPAFIDTRMKIYLYGSSGSGKSHILAALAFKLVQEGKRVLYIPDCSELLQDCTDLLRKALRFTFHNLPLLAAINEATTTEELVRIWKNHRGDYLLVNQLNVLDGHKKEFDIRFMLDSMGSGHHYVFSASANARSLATTIAKQLSIKSIYFFGGMSTVRDDVFLFLVN